MSKRKSQSALEFLTTYGWAFLVILIMIAALNYFGVLDPTRYLPDKCQASSGIGCVDAFLSRNEIPFDQSFVTFQLINNFGVQVDITSINGTIVGASQCTDLPSQGWVFITPDGTDPADPSDMLSESQYFNRPGMPMTSGSWGPGYNNITFPWRANELLMITFYCYDNGGTLTEGERPTLSFELGYNEAGSTYQRTIDGSVSGTVEK